MIMAVSILTGALVVLVLVGMFAPLRAPNRLALRTTLVCTLLTVCAALGVLLVAFLMLTLAGTPKLAVYPMMAAFAILPLGALSAVAFGIMASVWPNAFERSNDRFAASLYVLIATTVAVVSVVGMARLHDDWPGYLVAGLIIPIVPVLAGRRLALPKTSGRPRGFGSRAKSEEGETNLPHLEAISKVEAGLNRLRNAQALLHEPRKSSAPPIPPITTKPKSRTEPILAVAMPKMKPPAAPPAVTQVAGPTAEQPVSMPDRAKLDRKPALRGPTSGPASTTPTRQPAISTAVRRPTTPQHPGGARPVVPVVPPAAPTGMTRTTPPAPTTPARPAARSSTDEARPGGIRGAIAGGRMPDTPPRVVTKERTRQKMVVESPAAADLFALPGPHRHISIDSLVSVDGTSIMRICGTLSDRDDDGAQGRRAAER